MPLEQPNLSIVGALDEKTALELTKIDPTTLTDLNIANIWAWLSPFLKRIAGYSQGCDLWDIDPIYENEASFNQAVEQALKKFKADLDQLIQGHQSIPVAMRREELFQRATDEIRRRIELIEKREDVSMYVQAQDEEVEIGADNVFRRAPEFTEDTGNMHYIFMTSLFYAVHDPMKFLEEVDSHLDDDGKIVLIEPRKTYDPGVKWGIQVVGTKVETIQARSASGKQNIDYLYALVTGSNKVQAEALWIRLLGDSHDMFCAIEIKKGAFTALQFPTNPEVK